MARIAPHRLHMPIGLQSQHGLNAAEERGRAAWLSKIGRSLVAELWRWRMLARLAEQQLRAAVARGKRDERPCSSRSSSASRILLPLIDGPLLSQPRCGVDDLRWTVVRAGESLGLILRDLRAHQQAIVSLCRNDLCIRLPNWHSRDLCIRLPNWTGFVFGNLEWGPMPTHRMWVGLSRFTGIAHEPSLSVWRTSLAVKEVYDRACPIMATSCLNIIHSSRLDAGSLGIRVPRLPYLAE